MNSNGQVVDTGKPSVPGKPVCNYVYLSTISVTWSWEMSTDTASGIYGYYVCVSTTSGGADLKNDDFTAFSSYTYTGVQGGTYYCKVKSRNGAGIFSEYSAVSTGTIIDTTAPAAPVVIDDGKWTNAGPQLHAAWSDRKSVV